MRDHTTILLISWRRIQIYWTQHSFRCCALLQMDLYLNFCLDLVWQRRDITRMTRSLFKPKFHLDLYVTPLLSFLSTTVLYLRVNIHAWILARLTPPLLNSNFTLSKIFASLERAKLWTISCIRPNDSGSPNSFDQHHIKSQTRSLSLPLAQSLSGCVIDSKVITIN
jgi:hypothetical protein